VFVHTARTSISSDFDAYFFTAATFGVNVVHLPVLR
jgi:hypothetical protein